MNLGKRIITSLCAVALAAVAGTASAADKELRLGVEASYPPFSMKTEDGDLTGFDIEIARALCDAMNRECVFVETAWDGIIPALKARKFDAIVASMGITPERQRHVDFTNRYYYSPAALLAPKDNDLAATRAGTADATLGVQRATAHECYYEKHFADAELKRYNTTEEAYLDLQSDRVDALLVDTLPAMDWLEKDGRSSDYEFVADDLYDESCFGKGIGIAVRKSDDDLRKKLNAAIKEIRRTGAYQKINDKYFPDIDIYGPSE